MAEALTEERSSEPGNASNTGGPEPAPKKTKPAPAAPKEDAGNKRLPTLTAPHARVVAVLLSTAFVLWLFFSWRGYGARHAQIGEEWYVGGVHLIELTLVKEDARNLDCASELNVSNLHCAYRADGSTKFEDTDDKHILRPYKTVKGELLLGAGLWSTPGLKANLPNNRFSVTCNYHVVGVVRSAATRWERKSRFDPIKQTATFGYLSDCVLPQ